MENQENKVSPNYISIDDFAKIEIKLGTIIAAKEVEGSDKLYQLTVDFGETSTQEALELSPSLIGRVGEEPELKYRNVMSGIKKFRRVEDLLGKQFPFVTNLAPRKMMGKYISEAMILAVSNDDTGVESDAAQNFSLFPTENNLPNGTRLS